MSDTSAADVPDVDALTVREVRERVRGIDDPAVLQAMLAAERADVTRSTAVAAIEDRLGTVVGESDNTQADDAASESEPDGFSDTVIVRNPHKTARVYANVGRLQPGETTEAAAGAAREHIEAGELQVVTSRSV